MKILFYIIPTLLLLDVSVSNDCTPEYFWRPFNGDIPDDAFIAGSDECGDPLYIAQIVIFDSDPHRVSSAQLFHGNKYVDFALYNAEAKRITKFIHILCYDSVHTLQWVKYSNTTIKNCCLVEGGIQTDGGHMVYVGRTHINAETYIGRIADYWRDLAIMKGKKYMLYPKDEVLAYQCDRDYDED